MMSGSTSVGLAPLGKAIKSSNMPATMTPTPLTAF